MFTAVEKLARNPDLVNALQEIRLRVAELRQMIEKAVAVFDDVGPAAADALKQANSTLKTAESVLVDVQLASTKTLKQADTTLKTAQAFIHEDSSARHRLDRALEEFSKASEAIRNLAEYINQNPDAFLRGRGQ
jgi:paraquat-inducible protein B